MLSAAGAALRRGVASRHEHRPRKLASALRWYPPSGVGGYSPGGCALTLIQPTLAPMSESQHDVLLIEAGRLTTIGAWTRTVAHEINNPLLAILGLVEFVIEDVEDGTESQAFLELIQQERSRDQGRRSQIARVHARAGGRASRRPDGDPHRRDGRARPGTQPGGVRLDQRVLQPIGRRPSTETRTSSSRCSCTSSVRGERTMLDGGVLRIDVSCQGRAVRVAVTARRERPEASKSPPAEQSELRARPRRRARDRARARGRATPTRPTTRSRARADASRPRDDRLMPGSETLARCLLADDHPALAVAIGRVLADNGFELIGPAHDGREAIALAEQTRPDLALVDYRMPLVSGPALVSELRGRVPEMHVVVYTAEADAALVSEALRAGVAGLVLKQAPLTDLARAPSRLYRRGGHTSTRYSPATPSPIVYTTRNVSSPRVSSRYSACWPRECLTRRSVSDSRSAPRPCEHMRATRPAGSRRSTALRPWQPRFATA